MASYGLNADDDKVQRPKESTVMGSEMKKAQCTTLYVCDSIKRSVAKGFDRYWAYFLDHGPRTNTRWMTSPH
jgi:hypothetical protein